MVTVHPRPTPMPPTSAAPRRFWALLALFSSLALAPSRADAWSTQSAVMAGCHEAMIDDAFASLRTSLARPPVLPSGDRWRQVASWMLEGSSVDSASLDDAERFLRSSLIIGVRAPDSEGHATFDLDSQRDMNLDRSPALQRAHALRCSQDDFAAGDAAAVQGARALILRLVSKARAHRALPGPQQIISTSVYVEFYGEVAVEVWAPAYYLGRAAHALEDSFSHAIRSERDDFRLVVHVMNFIEAITGEIDETRDGVAHSNTFDECDNAAVAPIFEAATRATIGLLQVAGAQKDEAQAQEVPVLLDEWLTLEPGCTLDDGLCGNDHWLELARHDQSRPVLPACSMAAGRRRDVGPCPFGLLLVLGALLRRRRK